MEPSTPAPAPEPTQAPSPAPQTPSMQPPAPTPAAAAQSEQKDWLVALLLSIFVGGLGVDRFYLGYVGLGILKLVTWGGFGIWSLIDIILIATNKLNDSKGRPLHNSR